LLARIGDELNIRLDKRGWIFLGCNNQEIKDGLALTNREYGNNFTHFSFAAKKTGAYQLLFVFQDNSQGSQEKRIYDVQIMSADEFNKAMANLNSSSSFSPGTGAENTGSEYVDWLVQTGKYTEALTELLKNYSENVPWLNEQIANVYWLMHKPDMALTYWLKNLKQPAGMYNNDALPNDTYTEKALAGIIKSAIQTKNESLFLKYLNSLFTIKSFPVNEELLAAAKYCQTRQDYATAYDILNKWLTSNYDRDFLDEALFLLGKLYEESAKHKDYRKAREMYQRVYQEFPESLFARPAYERVNYLNQHYFYIR
jgi:tetratricopeptide (TPR) repeat protein